jgi:hypothetical protein
MFSGSISRITLVFFILSLVVFTMTSCGGQPTATEAPSPTAIPVTKAPATEPTPEEQDTEASAADAAPEQEGANTGGRAKLRLVAAEGGSAVEIWVDDVVDLYALDLQLTFDSSKFQAADANPDMDGIQLEPGKVPAPDFVAVNSVDNENGIVQYVVTQLGTSDAFSGSGLIATLKWQDGVTWQGEMGDESEIAFGAVTLVDRDVQQIEVTAQ